MYLMQMVGQNRAGTDPTPTTHACGLLEMCFFSGMGWMATGVFGRRLNGGNTEMGAAIDHMAGVPKSPMFRYTLGSS